MKLEAVTPETYEEVLGLQVAPDQERFVASVVKSLADAYVHQGAVFLTGRSAQTAVGYVLLFPFESAGASIVNIVRLMIDRRHQGLGHGRQLLASTLRWIATEMPGTQRLRISTLPDNARALDLYRSVGFVETGIEAGEIALYRDLHQ